MKWPGAILIFILGVFNPCFSQDEVQDKTVLDSLLRLEKYSEAAKHLKTHLSFYKTNQNLDSLASYPYYFGTITHKTSDAVTAINETENFIADLETRGATSRNLYVANMSYVSYLDETGKVQKSYDITEVALEHAENMPNKTPEEIGFIIYNLGASALGMGNFDLAGKHFREALQKYESYDKTPQTKLADAYNAMGASMWFTTKLDSARVFYNKSVESINKSDTDSISKKYLSAITLSNIALIQQGQGKPSEAMETLKKTLEYYEEVIKYSSNDTHITNAKAYKWNALTNLAVFYNDLGDYSMANRLVSHVLNNQLKQLDRDDPRIFKTRVKLGQSLMSLQNYREARDIFKQAYTDLENSHADEFYWKAITLLGLAESSEALGNNQEASEYYTQSESLFEKITKDGYDRQYLNFLVKSSTFMAKFGERDSAINLASKGYDYTVKNAQNDGLVQFKQLLNLSEVYYSLKDYERAKAHTGEALKLLKSIQNTGNRMDSVQVEFQKPITILIKARSDYFLEQDRDSIFLKKLYDEMQQTISILERQKSFSVSPENISALLENNKDVFDFIKKLGLELYNLTGNKEYLKKTLGYHESGLYYKIRGRLNKQNQMAFSGIPAEIAQKEKRLKENINRTLLENQDGLDPFFKATREWNTYLEHIQVTYPRYYKMRYETITESAITVQEHLDNSTTVVRYVMIGEGLYAFLITVNTLEVFPLEFDPVKEHIHKLNRRVNGAEEYKYLHELYTNIWQPFAPEIKTRNVVIIPDGELYNLSFESLVDKKITSPKDFIKHGLVAKYVISYNFSLLLLKEKNEKEFKTNFVAFVPGFLEKGKKGYSEAEINSPLVDNSYLMMLSQPFTLNLIKALGKKYHGKSFVEQHSTLENFKKNANNTKILHLGTHAETNNISPEFSRVFFSKDIAKPAEENFMYAWEVYNQDFSAHLAILTACETGRPSYQAGEGMISLAHAFHYAGSESLLTGIWKIDEQASAIIIGSFYDYLSEGFTKPEALQKAKLEYLSNVKGRALSPEYWAGIILMGDTSAIVLEEKSKMGFWILGILILLFIIYWIYQLGKSESFKNKESRKMV